MPIPREIKASVGLLRSQRFGGDCNPAEMPRLQSELAAPSAPLQVQLELRRDRQGQWLRGSIDGALMLECQRCAATYAWKLDLQVALLLVESEAEEQRVLEFADPYRIENDHLPLRELVEDEVLLALPIVPRCQECMSTLSAMPAAQAAKEEAPSKPANPFAQLSKKLNNESSSDSSDWRGAARPRRK